MNGKLRIALVVLFSAVLVFSGVQLARIGLAYKQALKRYRLMDIMELNLQKNHCKTFSFGTCIYSMKVQGGFTYRSKYFQLPLVQEMLNRKIYQTQNCGRVECHY